MTQLKTAPLAARPDIEAGTGAFPLIGTAKLAVTPLNAEILADECDPCAEVVSAEQNVANALWRLEIVGVTGTPGNPQRIALAWSEENACEIASADISPEAFERASKVYEYFSPITEAYAGVFANAADSRRSTFVDDLSATPNPATDHGGNAWPFVRRWDGFAEFETANPGAPTTLGGGFDISMTGGRITLRVTAFEAVLDITAAAVVRGDYWLVELRTFAPEGERLRLVKETPIGIQHHYCTLVTVNGAAIKPLADAERRKLSFPVLSDLPASHVGYDNHCDKLFGDAENVQQALDNLCSISAEDIGFTSNCPVLFGDSDNVQEALDALCNVDFSVQEPFRHMFDWGVVCGIVPSLVKKGTGLITITPGAYLDRAGRFRKFEGVTGFDLSSLKIGEGIAFEDERELSKALAGGEVCLALAGADGGTTTIHIVPKAIAFGPEDPGFAERVRRCVEKRKIIKFDDLVAPLSERQKIIASKVLLASTGGGAFSGTARLSRAEFADSLTFRAQVVKTFASVAEPDDVATLNTRIAKAEQDFPTANLAGPALEVRQMQQSIAVFAAYQETDQQRLQRCICEALFPTCPPGVGAPPYFVPIACIKGGRDQPQFYLEEVCAYCCRKQAMTWRSLNYFIGEMRANLAKALDRICCGDKRGGVGSFVRDPRRFATFNVKTFAEDFRLVNAFLDQPEKLPSDFITRVDVATLGAEQARTVLRGTGIEVAETVDINDAKALDVVQSKMAGLDATDILYSAGEVRPGDKVALLVQEGVARGYVLLERGAGKLPFERPALTLTGAVTEADRALADQLTRDVAAARAEINTLSKTREALVSGLGDLREQIVTLERERDLAAGSLTGVLGQLDELAQKRESIATQIDAMHNDLASADESRQAMLASLRGAQPVNVVLGNEADVIAKLAGEGITTVSDFEKLTPAQMKRMERAGILTEARLTELKVKASDFLKRR
ncbi:hypothetical protein LGR54_05535 [Ancylobacter sp. Lp-2]|uniref:hypothetical protein n=1 Tax=Ancylobacter sp. Lp-2 TaxID=2881339 RepID=UPI001E2ABD89|nr:hypothetical protein [Ancylobacter sp. Lp-2]MCB4768058.1 hypothetical protein [Ancylobacter sp. Lp-2]